MGDRLPPATPALRFSKMHGAGNDFVILDLRSDATLALRFAQSASGAAAGGTRELCRALGDRHTGVGYDQLLTIEPPRSDGAVASYRIWNADGSASQQCGNGARCVAAWLQRDGTARDDAFLLDSPTGTHAVEALGDGRYRIAMGVPQFAPQAIPLAGFVDPQDEYMVEIDGVRLRFGAVSTGNPHAVVEVDDVERAPVATLGPALQRDPAFPESANVGFAEVVARDHVRLRVHERGVGETLACGSGACAAMVVLARRGRVDREVTVSLPGGDLRIAWPDDAAQVTMAGPTAFVFEGEWLQ